VARVVDAADVKAGADRFDEPPQSAAAERFLTSPTKLPP
jgi:hypothetical protein